MRKDSNDLRRPHGPVARVRHGLLAALLLALVALVLPAGASAAPIFTIDQQNYPTNFAPGGSGRVIVVVGNRGDEPTSAPITATIALPEGMTLHPQSQTWWTCSGTQTVTCVTKPNAPTQNPGPSRYSGPDQVDITVDVAPSLSGTVTVASTLSGGGAPAEISTSRDITVSSTPAPFGARPGSFHAGARDADGRTDTRAGAHPFEVAAGFLMTTRQSSQGQLVTSGNTRNIDVDLPAGLIGNPTAFATCPAAKVSTPNPTCPIASQVGIANITIKITKVIVNASTPIYNMTPADGETAAFGFNVAGVPVHFSANVRSSGDYGLTVSLKHLSSFAGLLGTEFIMWGDPADPRHDPYRYNPDVGGFGATTNAARRPFLTNPTNCAAGPLTTTLRLDSYESPDVDLPYSDTTGSAVTGCDVLDFQPTFTAAPSTREADAPTGLETRLTFAQTDDVDTHGTPPLRTATVTLPEGLTINPSSANGLEACTDEQAGLRSDAPVACPGASKIGTATATTPVLADPLDGAIYLGTQKSDDPASGDMFRLILALRNELRGVTVKLLGHVKADPATGRLVVTFADNPQLPVSDLTLRFKDGPRAPLATPATCGRHDVVAELTPWSSAAPTTRSSGFTTDCRAGLGAFAPAFSAGSASSAAGAFSSFGLHVDRADGQQVVDGLTLQLPPGLLARLKGIPRCAEAQAATGACGAASRVGSATVGVGPGSAPFYLRDQPVFLTDGYKGGQFGLVVAARAKAGPFDLGTVVVRQAIHIDPIDAHVTVVSDPLPTIVKGVPLRMRSLDVVVDRPGFMVNPTSCEAKTIGGTLSAPDGRAVPISQRLQVSACKNLALTPKLSMSLSGRGQTRDGSHPALSAVLTQPGGQANLKRVRVTLPLSLALDPEQARSDDMCSFVEGSKVIPNCPAGSVVGRASAVTPILDEPLSGPVYFVKNQRVDPRTGRSKATLPKLVIPLVGQNGVRLTLTGTSATPDNEHLVTTFDDIPDAAVSSFKLDINGGKKGILVITGDAKTDICAAAQIAEQEIDGQNNKAADADVYVQTPSCPTKILSKKVTAKAVTLKVGGLGAGKVTVTGKGIKKTSKTIAKSTVATITARRTAGAVGKVTVTFDPAGPAKAKKTSR
ncbi:MAG TPA: hypothetical protein VFG42_24190 [Baekduia sp.]|uniref:hypothetical protein n=1 Tax=Baekduia sp. TaxID=2600305 RepID=UPI002D76E580|nr:hypothetical protein [Baekduia sp.]HET6509915.1 hypothetical protein [Baekduia sp.]